MSNESSVIRTLEEKLKEVTKELEKSAQFPQSNPHYVIRVSSKGELLFANEASKNTVFSKNISLSKSTKTIHKSCKLFTVWFPKKLNGHEFW